MVLAAKALFVTGILNIIFIVVIAFTCRCVGMNSLSKGLFKKAWFNKLYKYHCYYWYAFFISTIIHTILGFYLFGVPF